MSADLVRLFFPSTQEITKFISFDETVLSYFNIEKLKFISLSSFCCAYILNHFYGLVLVMMIDSQLKDTGQSHSNKIQGIK